MTQPILTEPEAQRDLDELERLGLVQRVQYLPDMEPVYVLTAKGREYLRDDANTRESED